MTFAAACGWSLLRAAIVALLGVWGAVHLARLMARLGGGRRIAAWCVILAPCLSPGLIVGYGYRNYSLSLVHHPWLNEALYAAILIGQAAPVGALLMYFAPPPPLSASGVHCWRMGPARRSNSSIRSRLADWLISFRGPGQAWLPAAAIIFLIAFQESEVAALMQVRGWPEWLFTRYAGLVDLTATRHRMLLLVAIQAVVMAPVIGWQWRALQSSRAAARDPVRPAGHLWWLWPMLALLVVTLVPGGVVLKGAWQGLISISRQPSFWRELAHGLAFAMTAGAIACTLAGSLIRRLERRRLDGRRSSGESFPIRNTAAGENPPRFAPLPVPYPTPKRRSDVWKPLVLGLLMLPGLCGSMTLALLVDDLFQQPWLRWAYDSPARVLTALALSLFPRAVLVQTCLPYDRRSAERHAADLLQSGSARQRISGRELDWRLHGRPRFWAYVLVCSWGYLDLMIATISAPPGMEPVVKRLYNFMHFGHIASLSAMVCVTVATPLLLAGLFLAGRRWWNTWTAE